MKFNASGVIDSKLCATAELFIENPQLLQGTRLLCEQGSADELNNESGWLHQKISQQLDRLSSLKSNAIMSVNDIYFDQSNILEAMEANRGNRTFDELYAEKIPPLLNALEITFDQIISEGRSGDSLKKIHEKTACLAVYFDEGPDFSNTYLIVKDPLGRIWQVGEGYVEGSFDEWGGLS